MREILPKIIVVVVLVAVIGGAVMMVTRHKNTASVAVPGATQSAAPSSPAPPPPVAQESRKYKRDMLGYEDTNIVTTPAIKSAPASAQSHANVTVYGSIPGVPPSVGGSANSAPPPVPAVVPAEYAGRTTLQADKLAHQIRLESPQLKAGEKISLYYTCNQKNVSPPLNWSNAPSGTKGFVVLLEGPDKGRGQPLQWGVYNIPASQASLGEAVPKIPLNEKGVGQAQTELGPVGYAGPCIPKGEGVFVFSIYALDTELKLQGGVTRNELIKAMNGHVIDMAKLPVTHYFRL